MKMTPEDLVVIGAEPCGHGEIQVATRAPVGYDWPATHEHKGRTYRFVSQEPIPFGSSVAKHFYGQALYKSEDVLV